MLTAVLLLVAIQIVGMILGFMGIGDSRAASDHSGRLEGDGHR